MFIFICHYISFGTDSNATPLNLRSLPVNQAWHALCACANDGLCAERIPGVCVYDARYLKLLGSGRTRTGTCIVFRIQLQVESRFVGKILRL